MNVEDFALACARFNREGFEVRRAECDDRIFGSWTIDFSLGKRGTRRLIWDGTDGWLILQVRRDDTWKDVWIARDRADQTVERTISEIHAAP